MRVTRNNGGSWKVQFDDGKIIDFIFAKDNIEAEEIATSMKDRGRT